MGLGLSGRRFGGQKRRWYVTPAQLFAFQSQMEAIQHRAALSGRMPKSPQEAAALDRRISAEIYAWARVQPGFPAGFVLGEDTLDLVVGTGAQAAVRADSALVLATA